MALALFLSASLVAQDTELNLYRPFTETTKQPPMTIIAKQAGECYQQSLRIKREDAWRCIANTKVYDPCFVERFGSKIKAICIESPWSNQGIEITVLSPLDNRQHESLDMSKTFPWALELSDGPKCWSVNKPDLYDGLPVRYQCEGESSLIGHVQRCHNTWKMLQHSPNGVLPVDIVRAWF